MGVTRDPRVLPLVVEASRDKDSLVRGDAVRAMKDLGDARAVPRKLGRTMTVALDESHRTARLRVGRTFRVHVKVGDKVVDDQRLASVVTKNGGFDLVMARTRARELRRCKN